MRRKAPVSIVFDVDIACVYNHEIVQFVEHLDYAHVAHE